MLSMLLRVLNQFLYRLREAHTVDAALDSKALDNGLLNGKIRRHLFSTSWIGLSVMLEFLVATGMCLTWKLSLL